MHQKPFSASYTLHLIGEKVLGGGRKRQSKKERKKEGGKMKIWKEKGRTNFQFTSPLISRPDP